MIEQIKSTLTQIKQNNPLILCLTNYVTMDFMANSLLALGAAPLMSESKDEIEELTSLSQAIYINIGTLDDLFMERARLAVRIANSLNKPVILDPVGAGASKLRTTAAMELLPLANIIRGNASEIISLTGADAATKGVNTSESVPMAMSSAKILAKKNNKIIVISGPEDFVTNGEHHQLLTFGSQLMPLITGMGCTMTAILGAFVASNPDYYQATIQATAYFSLCGQLTQQHTTTPGTFKQAFIDYLFAPDWDFFAHLAEKPEHAL